MNSEATRTALSNIIAPHLAQVGHLVDYPCQLSTNMLLIRQEETGHCTRDTVRSVSLFDCLCQRITNMLLMRQTETDHCTCDTVRSVSKGVEPTRQFLNGMQGKGKLHHLSLWQTPCACVEAPSCNAFLSEFGRGM